MRLLRLSLKNFKGIRDLTIEADGRNIAIYGDNATGKTTIFDAFTWLLFDKDSQGRKDFEIKTLTPSGEAIHGLEHAVEGVLEVGGKTVTLRKVFSEKWTKQRGSAEKTFTGHTTDYYVNGVPVKKTEYEARVTSIADERLFKVLTDPTYFSERLRWDDRRAVLLEVCGDVSDADVIASDKALAELPAILGERSLEDHRKVLAARRAEINRELEKIPVRISEVQQSISQTVSEPERIPELLAQLRAELQEKQQELARLESGGEIAEKTAALRKLEAEIYELQRAAQQEADRAREGKRRELEGLQRQQYETLQAMRASEDKAAANWRTIRECEERMDKLRKEWQAVNAQEFAGEDTCPTCGQALPEDQIEAARAKFNATKSERLTKIQTEGKALKAKADQLRQENETIEKEVKKLQEQAVTVAARIRELQEAIAQVPAATSNEIEEKLQGVELLKVSIEELKAGGAEAKQAILADISKTQEAISALEQAAAQVEANKRAEARIEELKTQERALAAEYERLEKELYLTEEFVRRKVALLEEKINSRFRMARFKLFEQQINGGIAECCETLYQGVPYSGGLNNAARINVGLDIINTLSEHYGVEMPVFIDNREAVTELIETRGQVISLIVSERDKTLRIEKEEK